MSKKSPYPFPEVLEQYTRIVEAVGGLEVKGKANPYTSVNGHMFSFIDKAGIMSVRLEDEMLKKFMEDYDTGPSIQYGATMRGYALVPEELFRDTDTMAGYLKKSFTSVSGLKPNPTKKKK